MITKICTSIEQSKKLIELGIDVGTSDMWINVDRWYDITISSSMISSEDVPAWSLSALLNVIPKRIKDNNVLRIDINEHNTSIWYDEIGYGVNNKLPDITKESAVDACYEIIIELHKLKML